MQFKKINGSTYYIPSATNIGVFSFRDKYTLIIDTGNNNQQAKKITDLLSENQLNIKYLLNTHHHPDHAGGNIFLKEHFPGSILLTSEAEELFLSNPYLFPLYLFGGNPIKELTKHFLRGKKVAIDQKINIGENKINNEKFDILSLPGHSMGQVGIATKDRVCFLADSLFGPEIIRKYKIPFLFDIEAQFNTYHYIENLDYDFFIPSHSELIYNDNTIKSLVKINKVNLEKYLNIILEILVQPKTKEELLEEIIILEDISVDFKEYFFSLSTISAMITYLYEHENLEYQLENGKLYFYCR